MAVAFAAVSFVAGDGLAALKWLVLAFSGPMVAYCAGFTVWFVRQPGWYRRPPDVAWVAGLSGVVLLFVPILVSLPWAANRMPLDSLPFGLSLLVNLGIALTSFGAITGIVLGFWSGWRRRDYGQLVFVALMAMLIGYVFLLREIGERT